MKKILFAIFCYILFLIATVDITKNISLGNKAIAKENIEVPTAEKIQKPQEQKTAVTNENKVEKPAETGEKNVEVKQAVQPKKTVKAEKTIEPEKAVKEEKAAEPKKAVQQTGSKYKYAIGNVRVFTDTKITPKAEDNLKNSTRVEVVEKKTVDIIKNKTVKKPDGREWHLEYLGKRGFER